MNAIDLKDFIDLKTQIETETGFVCYDIPNQQTTWFGTSDKFERFKELVEPIAETGTLAYTMDDKQNHFWSEYKKTWY